jgi:uncharacterized protein (TIGR03435 family)
MPARILVVAALLAALPVAASTQAPKTPAFEVASITPATMPTPELIMSGNARIGMTVTDTRVDIGFMSLNDLMMRAFRLQPYQVSGPPWLNEPRFDIKATIPPGVSKDQVPEMLQALLAERFGLVSHREQREMPVYALVVGKDGHKLGKAEELPPPPAEPVPGEISLNTGESQVRLTPGAGKTVSMVMTDPRTGPVRLHLDPATGEMNMEMLAVSMASLSEMLTSLTDRPVIDRTGLAGTHAATIKLSMADMLNAARAAGMGSLLPPGMGAPAIGGQAPALGAADPSGNSIQLAVQRLGLRLDSQRSPIEVVVIDKVEKAPTAN